MRTLAVSVAGIFAISCSSSGGAAPRSTPGLDGGGGGGSADGPGGGGGVDMAGPGTPDMAAVDAPAMQALDSAVAPMGEGGVAVVIDDPTTWPGGAFGKDFIVACPEGAPRVACCAHYCGCMMKNCPSQSPNDCMAACVSTAGVQKWDLRCRVYNCFESLNPLAQKDHTAHCEHAGVYTGSQRTRGAGDTHAKCHMAGEPDEP